jgi:replication factor C subunit 1
MGNQIVPRLRAICAKEGLQVSDAALQSLAEGANGDIRLILGQLQMIRLRHTRVEYDDVRVSPPTLKYPPPHAVFDPPSPHSCGI